MVQYRASLEQDIAAVRRIPPDLAIGTTPVVQARQGRAIAGAVLHQPDFRPPLMGPLHGCRFAGPGGQWQQLATKARFEQMREFFGDVGGGDKPPASGKGVPQELRPEFRAFYQAPGHQDSEEAQSRRR